MKNGIPFEMVDNAFLYIDNPKRAQTLANRLDAKQLHRRLDKWADLYCPVHQRFTSGYHWSFMQAEYATDVVFHQQTEFQPHYESIIRIAVHTIKADNVATFPGRKLTTAYQGKLVNDFSTRIQDTCVRHQMGPTSIKLYDKAGNMVRVDASLMIPPFSGSTDGWNSAMVTKNEN